MSRLRRVPWVRARTFRSLGYLCCAAAFGGCGSTPDSFEPVPASITASRLEPDLLDEASGLAASRRDDDLLWGINDSGNAPLLFALDQKGNLRGRARVRGVGNVDWEDLATFELDGRSWILVADVGDNQNERNETTLLIIEEPDPARLRPGKDIEVRVTAYLPVSFPGGPRDCEAVAVDPISRQIILLSKRHVPPVAYALPLTLDSIAAARSPEAREIAPLRRLPQPDAMQRMVPMPAGLWRSQPTSLDISPDGRLAAVLTYGDVWLYSRNGDESWARAFQRAPRQLPPHRLSQGEAVAFSRDGRSLFVTSEGSHAPLLHYSLPKDL